MERVSSEERSGSTGGKVGYLEWEVKRSMTKLYSGNSSDLEQKMSYVIVLHQHFGTYNPHSSISSNLKLSSAFRPEFLRSPSLQSNP